MIYMMKAACPRPVLNEYERQRSMSLVPLPRGPEAERRCLKHIYHVETP